MKKYLFALPLIAACNQLKKSSAYKEEGSSNQGLVVNDLQKSPKKLVLLAQISSSQYIVELCGAIVLSSNYPENAYKDIECYFENNALPFFFNGGVSLESAKKIWDKGGRIFNKEGILNNEHAKRSPKECKEIHPAIKKPILDCIKPLSKIKIKLNSYNKNTYDHLKELKKWLDNYCIKHFNAESGNKLLSYWINLNKSIDICNCAAAIQIKFPSLFKVLLNHDSIRRGINKPLIEENNKFHNDISSWNTKIPLLHFVLKKFHSIDNFESIIEMLLKAGASLNALDSKERHCFYYLLEYMNWRHTKYLSIFQYLVKYVPESEKIEYAKTFWNYLLKAPEFQRSPILKYEFFSSQKEKPEFKFLETTYQDKDGYTIVHHLVKDGLEEKTMELVFKDPKIINVKNNEDDTPAHIALSDLSRKGTKIFEMFLESPETRDEIKKIIGQQNKNGENLFHLAIKTASWESEASRPSLGESRYESEKPKPKIWEILFDLVVALPKTEISQIINQQDKEGNTVLHTAINYIKKKDIEKLLTLPNIAEIINQKNKEGNTPVHIAIKNRNENILQKLLAKGAETDHKNANDHTPLELAKERYDFYGRKCHKCDTAIDWKYHFAITTNILINHEAKKNGNYPGDLITIEDIYPDRDRREIYRERFNKQCQLKS